MNIKKYNCFALASGIVIANFILLFTDIGPDTFMLNVAFILIVLGIILD